MTTRLLIGDVFEGLARLPDASVQCVVTSPPYWGLRDYGVPGQLGLEPTLAEHLEAMVEVFREVRRVLRPDGTCWVNYGDCYATTPNGRRADETNATGHDDRTFRDKPFSTIGGTLKPKDLCMVPNRLAIALQDDGWWVRSEIIWNKPNPMPDSVKDRPGVAHEKMFLLAKSPRYFYDPEAVKEAATSGNLPTVGGWATDGGSHSARDWNKGGSRPAAMKADGEARPAQPEGFARNLRNVWTVAARPLDVEACEACARVYVGADVRRLSRRAVERPDGRKVLHRVCRCGRHDAWVSHFATFPPGIVEPCIKAGTPEAGSCSACGAPWVRVIDVEYVDRPDCRPGRERRPDQYADGNRWGQYPDKRRRASTTGWRPSCGCEGATPAPAVVLDPFGGAGAVALVADRLQRDGVLIELHPVYAAMAQARLVAEGGILARVETERLAAETPTAEGAA